MARYGRICKHDKKSKRIYGYNKIQGYVLNKLITNLNWIISVVQD